MDSLRELFERKRISISLHVFDAPDLFSAWEVKSILDNTDIFKDLFKLFPLNAVSNLEEYYRYLLFWKLSKIHSIIPVLKSDEDKEFIKELSEHAENEVSKIGLGPVLKYINTSIQEIFTSGEGLSDMRVVTVDIIAQYSTSVPKRTLEFLAKDYGFWFVDRFEQFEKSLEKYPDLFELVFPADHIIETCCSRYDEVLEIWSHILNKPKSKLKTIVENRINALAEEVKKASETATIDNIIRTEGFIRKFHSFLQGIKSPMAYEFAEYAKAAEDLLSKSIQENGHKFQFEIPVQKIVEQWKSTENWEIRLLRLTHEFKDVDGNVSCVSRLSVAPGEKHSFMDSVSTNIPTDDYFTLSHQQMLSIVLTIGAATLFEIEREQESLDEYQKLITSAITIISEQLNAEGEHLEQDAKMLFSMIQMIASETCQKSDFIQGICYGTATYLCAFSEKLLRILYLHLIKDEKYVPINKATLGELLDEKNPQMVSVFGKDHIKNLAFFLNHVMPSNIGCNIRNSLAHWAKLSPNDMTPLFVTRLLWLFTDIVNTLFWYCIKDLPETGLNEE